LYWAPEPERVLALSEEAVTLARQLGDPRDLAAVLRARWIALWRPETAEERLAIADEIVRLGERTADRELALLGRRFRIVGFLEQGDVVAADREIEAWAQIAGELRQPRYLTDLAMWRATRAIMDGRFAEGEEHARRALELGEREPEVEPAMRHAVQMAVLQFHRGQLEHAIGAAGPRSYAPAAMLLRCHRIFSWSETGRTAEARRDLRALAKDGFELPRDGGWLVYTSLLAAVAAELNDRARAQPRGSSGWMGWWQRCAGSVWRPRRRSAAGNRPMAMRSFATRATSGPSPTPVRPSACGTARASATSRSCSPIPARRSTSRT